MEPANGCLPVRCPASLPHHPGQPEPRFSDMTQHPACGLGPPPSLPSPSFPPREENWTMIPHHWPPAGTSQHVSGVSGVSGVGILILWKPSCLWREPGAGKRGSSLFCFPQGFEME